MTYFDSTPIFDSVVISRHMFRRTARHEARRLREQGRHAVAVPAARFPYRWAVRGEDRPWATA